MGDENKFVGHEICTSNHKALNDRLDLLFHRADERHNELRSDIADLKAVVTNGLTTRMNKVEAHMDNNKREMDSRRALQNKIQTAVIGLLVVGTGSVIVFVLKLYLVNQP